MPVPCNPRRRPVRAAFAFAGGGSLGTFLSGAARETLLAIRAHNAACADPATLDDDPRLLRPEWGHITVDAVAGTSAGALCTAQTVKALYCPDYLGGHGAIDAEQTMSGDWIHGGDFEHLSVEGNTPTRADQVEAPGWTLLSGAHLYELAQRAVAWGEPVLDPASPLDATGVVGVGIMLTDLLGFHEPAEFAEGSVLGHPAFGANPAGPSRLVHRRGARVHDLGGKGHAELRKLFVTRDSAGADTVRAFLGDTQRRGRARVATWGDDASRRLAALCAASAALPLAVGPVAVTDSRSDLGFVYRRLYMDGGIMNNKPISPSLRLARWHDGVRLTTQRHRRPDAFDVDVVCRELVYDRVCFFFDAFPDRAVDEWRSAHPDQVTRQSGIWTSTEAAVAERERRIDAALAAPMSGMNVFFESIMTSLRAQDMQEIARTNDRLQARADFIDRLCEQELASMGPFELDSIERAQAYASVMSRPAGAAMTHEQRMLVAHRVWESDRVSGLAGRREVTMVPVFAPQNLRAVFAGEAMYALGGLLSIEARRHDADVGAHVARSVLDALRLPTVSPRSGLRNAPDDVVPDDTAPVVRRLKVAAEAAIDGRGLGGNTIKFFAKLPLRLEPVMALLKGRLDRVVRGQPDPPAPRAPTHPDHDTSDDDET